MKKLTKELDKFAKRTLISLPKVTRNLLYDFITDIAIQIRDKNETKNF